MKAKSRLAVTTALVGGLTFGALPSAQAAVTYDCSQTYSNDSEEDTYVGFRKYLQGEMGGMIGVHAMWSDVFPVRYHWYDGTMQVLEWTGATVAPGESATMCFNIAYPGCTVVHVRGAEWLAPVPITDAGFALGGGADIYPTVPGYAQVNLNVSNHWDSQFSGTADILASEVYYAVIYDRVPIDELDQNVIFAYDWLPLSDMALTYGDTEVIPLGEFSTDAYILFRFSTSLGRAQQGSVLEIWQIPVDQTVAVPTLSEWGMIALATVMVGTGAMIFRKRSLVVGTAHRPCPR